MYDFIISGAGLAGALTAKALLGSGYSVFLFDKAAGISFDGRTSAVSYGSQQILQELGFWNAIAPFASPMYEIFTSSSQKSLFYLHFDSKDFLLFNKQKQISKNERDDAKFPLAYTVPNHVLQTVFNEGIKVNFNLDYDSWLDDGKKVKVFFKEGFSVEGRIFICAEGKHSNLRKVCKIPTYHKKYSQYAITCSVMHDMPHNNVAQEIFYDAPFALLPLKDPNESSLIFTIKSDFAHLLFKSGDELFIKMVNQKCALGVNKITTKKFFFPLSLTFALKYSVGRVLFIGDAIHSIHPVAGQGFNLTIYDLDVLLKAIKLFDFNSDKYKYIFSKFYHERFSENFKMALFTDGIIKMFSIDGMLIKAIRNSAISVIDNTSVLKNFLINQAIKYEK